VLSGGSRIIISAGGSGTFNAVLEGCADSAGSLQETRLGFLRKGSADLIGKALGMPDDIEAAIDVFTAAIERDRVVPCDVLLAEDGGQASPSRHFVGYGGAGIFGRIPHYTENRFMKWYKGVAGQLFGDLGPFTIGMSLALVERLVKAPWQGKQRWRIEADGIEVARDRAYQSMLIVNGYLGPNLSYTDDALGSGRFHLFALRDEGALALIRQAVKSRNGSIMEDPEKWGLEHYVCLDTLTLEPATHGDFPVNVDGAAMACSKWASFRRADRIHLYSRERIARKTAES
jgi:diacylglycerol kinase family enzyme